jgi:hypothetical protein
MITFRPRRQLPGAWIRIPTESQTFWPVAFATDTNAPEAQVGIIVTKPVTRLEIICVWEGTSTYGTEPPTGYDPKRIYDSHTGSKFRLDGLSYGPWVGDPLQLDRYNMKGIRQTFPQGRTNRRPRHECIGMDSISVSRGADTETLQ